MLNNDALQQLKQLKQQLKSQKEVFSATVKDSGAKSGQVILDNGRQIFLPQEEMQKVFPHDRIKVTLCVDSKGQDFAEVEELIDSSLSEFTGQIIGRGKAVFVEPDVGRLSRWIFIPPHQLSGAKAGDFVRCRITQHPIKSGKPKAEVISIIGHPDQPYIEHNYIIDKHKLDLAWPESVQAEVDAIEAQAQEAIASANRKDMTNLSWLTIDAESTQDMDDALYAEALTDGGWLLRVAIADPAFWIKPDSALDVEARKRSTSVYLPKQTIPMLPESLSHNWCSLVPGEARLALVCELKVSEQGEVVSSELYQAKVRSQAKLSYDAVSDYLDGVEDNSVATENPELLPVIDCLQQVQGALNAYREQHAVCFENRPDYYFELDEQGKIAAIHRQHRSTANRLVEACMIAANCAAADFLAQKAPKAIYISHSGVRSDRLEDVKKLVAELLPEFDTEALNKPEGYRQLIHSLNNKSVDVPLRTIVSRQLERSLFSLEPGFHSGMGFERYTTFTSPIRKYNDLVLHRIIIALLDEQPVPEVATGLLDELQAGQQKARFSANEVEQWLKCQFMEDKVEQTFTATVVQVNPFGVLARLDDFGIDGFVDLRRKDPKFAYDPLYQQTSNGEQQFMLDQSIEVKVSSVDMKRRNLKLTLVAS